MVVMLNICSLFYNWGCVVVNLIFLILFGGERKERGG